MNIDILGREEFVKRVFDIVYSLSEIKKGGCFAIDGEWGIGKSFVLDMIEQQLAIIQSEETTDNRFLIFHYNCWKYDYYNEPSIAVISAMLDTTEKELSFWRIKQNQNIISAWNMAKKQLAKAAEKFIENKIGVNLVELGMTFLDEKREVGKLQEQKFEFDKLFSFRRTIDEVRKNLEEIAKDKTVVIVVDELDRCIPEYAIKVLERLHHLFDGIPNIIVIVAVDSKQLEHSVKQIYGEGTAVEKYLKKFISFSLKLDNGSIKEGIFKKYESFFAKFDSPGMEEKKYIEKITSQILDDIEMREREKIFERAELIHSMITSEIQDISLCMFEIMVIRYMRIGYSKDLLWIVQINKNRNYKLEEFLTSNHIEFLKSLENKVGNGNSIIYNNSSRYKRLGNTINDKIYWYFSKCFSTEPEYYMEQVNAYDKEVGIAKQFYKLVQAME